MSVRRRHSPRSGAGHLFRCFGLSTLLASTLAHAQVSGLFPIVANSPPSGQQTTARLEEVANANFTVLSGSSGFNRTLNGINLDLIERYSGPSSAGALRYLVGDVDLSDANILSYAGHPSLLGYGVYDEPSGLQLNSVATALNRIRALDPQHSTNLVNLYPTYAETRAFVVPRTATLSQTAGGDGQWVSPTNRLGQTFKTRPARSSLERTIHLKKIELNLDARAWAPDEALTLTLWDAAYTTRLATRTVSGMHYLGEPGYTFTGSNNGYLPQFDLDVELLPDSYYSWELTHSGGGNQSVGWVVRSTTPAAYPDGTALINGVAQPNDWYFQVYEGLARETQQSQTCARDGYWVSQESVMGQDFTVPADTVHPLEYVELNVDNYNWGPGEALTLSIYPWVGAATPLASATVTQPDPGLHPRFYFHTLRLNPGARYYMELTHNGGGDGYQGWVTYSASSCGDAYPGGTGYLNRQPRTWDLTFRQVYGLDAYAEYVDAWLEKGTPPMLSYDHYPFLANGDREDYFLNLAFIRDRAVARGVPFWGYIQSVGMRGQDNTQANRLGGWIYRNPTASELRWNIYTQLAYGAKGINYFLYWGVGCAYVGGTWSCCDGAACFTRPVILEDGTKNPVLYPAAQQLNGELKMLAPTLLSLTSLGVYHSGPRLLGTLNVPATLPLQPTNASQPLVLGHFRKTDGRQAVMVVNRNYNSEQLVSFSLPSRPSWVSEASKGGWTGGSEVYVPGSCTTGTEGYCASTGILQVRLAPGDGRLILLPSGY
jgi:hypothetical protein